jgi:hypothetical protein
LDKRFESYDWFKAIGGFVFLAAALLPWWQSNTNGFEFHRNGLHDWLGIIATVVFVGIAILTVIVETDSLPIPRRFLDPTWILGAGIVGSLCLLVRTVFSSFGAADSSRDVGLYLALVAAVLSMVGCVVAYQRRDEWRASLDAEPRPEADDEPGLADFDHDEQDELIRRINESLDRNTTTPPPAPRRRPTHHETDHERRRAERKQRAAERSTTERRSARRRENGAPPVT